ncbi:MAG TPA: prepilin-type N-terminal cleavage/methylation domain-containing protein [Verrucomicrobiae bacterium]|nr:prepilin-type N-terminal cleavage/methylation domain-containing protein [Verrucomicrobiae bacterium]
MTQATVAFLALGLLSLLGAGLGVAMGRAGRQSDAQAHHLLQFWAALAIGFLGVLLPVWLLIVAGPSPERHPAFWQAASLWMVLTYLVLIVALLRWHWQWWRDLPLREADTRNATPKRLVAWVAAGTVVPAIIFCLCAYGFYAETPWRVQQIPTTTVLRIINESKGAKFEVYQRKNGVKTLWITLPGRNHMRFDAPADDDTLALLARNGIPCKTHVEAQNRSLDALAGHARLLFVLSGFVLAPAGAVALALLLRKPAKPLAPYYARRPAAPETPAFDRIMLNLRTDSAPWKTFGYVAAVVFLLGFVASAIFVSQINAPGWYMSTVRLKAQSSGSLEQQMALIKSDAVAGLVVTNLDLPRKWGGKFTGGRRLTAIDAMNVLKRLTMVRAITNSSEITISVYDTDRVGTANLANTIAQVSCEQSGDGPAALQIAARAVPPSKGLNGNIRLILMIAGGILSVLLGLAIGIPAAIVRAWSRSRNGAQPVLRPAHASSAAFTLIELLVVIAIISILAALLFPALSRGKQKAQGVYCLNNGRQLMTAMTVYVGDNKDLFPPNPDDGNTVTGHNWCGGQAGQGGRDQFDPDLLSNPKRSLLAPYLNGNTSVFHCPGDRRTGYYQGSDPALLGRIVSAARTFSMSQAVGTICQGFDAGASTGAWTPHVGAPTLPVNGPWLNDQRTHRRDTPWRTYGKFSAIAAPGPAMLWVLVDEDARGLNDAAFAFGMEESMWIDAPGTYHSGGCGFAFADGHSESHRWLSPSPKQVRAGTANPQDTQDWLWMRDRTSAHISGSMPPPH